MILACETYITLSEEDLYIITIATATSVLPRIAWGLIWSYANRSSKSPSAKAGGRAEKEAAWAGKEYHYIDKKGKKQIKTEWHYGFKVHLICDVKTELPIAYNVLAANSDEKKAMIDMLAKLPYELKRQMDYLTLDKGYDSTEMIRQIKAAGIRPIVDIRNCWKDAEVTRQYKETDIVYDYQGNVFFVDDRGNQHRMIYEGYDVQKKCLRYAHKGKIYKIYISYDERVFLPVARDSMKFARLYIPQRFRAIMNRPYRE